MRPSFISAALQSLFTQKKLVPISASDLLHQVIAFKPPKDLIPNKSARFRLTDFARFEAVLEKLASSWDRGKLSVIRDSGELIVVDVVLNPSPSDGLAHSRKRKRVVDEEADSAAGHDSDVDDSFLDEIPKSWSALATLGKEQREIYAMMQKSTAKGRLLAEQFQSEQDSFEPICPQVTKDECAKARRTDGPSTVATICDLIHFRPLIRPHTDPSLGHCSYLNTCYSEPTYSQSPSIPPFPGASHVLQPGSRGPTSLPSGLGAGGRGKEKAPCRYLHYEVDWDGTDGDVTHTAGKEIAYKPTHRLEIGQGPSGPSMKALPPQWINCDLRRFDYSVLGKFHVIMADPPWDIHMSLPYGTMTDDEMRAMPIPALQDEGLLFLWVTGRAMEVGRECLRVWGYTRVDEVVWVKTNQLQRVIRTGRTGHWLNHTKEHMLVGVKTVTDAFGALKFPSWVNRGLDTDVIVSEVRETSRKPDEVYGIIERMCPGGRKVEIFGRKHNTRPGWLTLGNQLGSADQICEEDLAERIRAKYPDRTINFVGPRQGR